MSTSTNQTELPGPRTLVTGWFNGKAKSWLGFPTFLKQRRAILKDPSLSHTPPVSDGWKSPYDFAMSGALLVALCAGAGSVVVNYMLPTHAFGDETWNAMRDLPMVSWLAFFAGSPVAIYVMAYIFPIGLLAWGGKSIGRPDKVRQVFLYLYPAKTFWPLVMVITWVAVIYALIFHGVLDPDSDSIFVPSTPTWFVWFMIWFSIVMAMGGLIWLFFANISLARAICKAVDFQDRFGALKAFIVLYVATQVALIVAQIVAFVSLMLIVVGVAVKEAVQAQFGWANKPNR
jgi:hypothetical protein